MTFVVDASAMLCWCFEDEQPRHADKILKQMVQGGMIAPSHWPLELTNILRIGERKGRIAPADTTTFLSLVDSLGVAIDPETARRAWTNTRLLAASENLTTSDAAYLELAIRRQADLASKDAELLQAAQRRKLGVLDLSV